MNSSENRRLAALFNSLQIEVPPGIELPGVADNRNRYRRIRRHIPTPAHWRLFAVKTLGIWLLILAALATAAPLAGQNPPVPAPEPGHIIGTVLDTNGDTLSGATVFLQGAALKDPRKVVSDDNGFFEFKQVDPGSYRVAITAPDFADWTSPDFVLNPGQYMILGETKLRLTQVTTSVNVTNTAEEIATEEVKIEETQRVFGIIPNFYVVYEPNPVPLTTKLKFQLAMKTSTD